jgi:DNA-directed RNA polymerase subunit M
MLPDKEGLVCKKCGYKHAKEKSNEAIMIKEKNGKDEIPIIDNIETLPKTKKSCAKCGNNEAFWWLMQTRKADEGETHFYKCTKCGYTWREY